MTYEFLGKERVPVYGWVKDVPIDEKAVQQLRNVAMMPFVYHHVAAMPDMHWGMGATVGSVIATKGAIIPAAVGVDIGCGMMAVRTNIRAEHLPDNLLGLRTEIERRIPHGRSENGGEGDVGSWNAEDAAPLPADLRAGLDSITVKHPKLERASLRAERHLGTLGTGNHFVEVCLDTEGRVWIMLHSGSRGIGNAIGTYFIEKAKEEMRRWHINLPDIDLAYLPEGSQYFDDYIEALSWGQDFARRNRESMMAGALLALGEIMGQQITTSEEAVNCHHNYATRENHFGQNVWLTRKGAVRARKGDLGIIPGSMGVRSYIVSGLGNADSFCSCSHGAGRVMSRGEAVRKISLADHEAATQGVECRKDESVLDESPAAYKPIEKVMAAQSDLVEIVYELKQVICVKG